MTSEAGLLRPGLLDCRTVYRMCGHATSPNTHTLLLTFLQASRGVERPCQPAVHVFHLPALPLPTHHHGHGIPGAGEVCCVILALLVFVRHIICCSTTSHPPPPLTWRSWCRLGMLCALWACLVCVPHRFYMQGVVCPHNQGTRWAEIGCNSY